MDLGTLTLNVESERGHRPKLVFENGYVIIDGNIVFSYSDGKGDHASKKDSKKTESHDQKSGSSYKTDSGYDHVKSRIRARRRKLLGITRQRDRSGRIHNRIRLYHPSNRLERKVGENYIASPSYDPLQKQESEYNPKHYAGNAQKKPGLVTIVIGSSKREYKVRSGGPQVFRYAIGSKKDIKPKKGAKTTVKLLGAGTGLGLNGLPMRVGGKGSSNIKTALRWVSKTKGRKSVVQAKASTYYVHQAKKKSYDDYE